MTSGEMSTASSSLPGNERASMLVARIERLRISPWHVKARLVMGVATFFDAFDVLAIAYVLPVLAGLWKLRPQEIGLMISMGFVGQIAGAIFFGWLAERIGRIRAATYSMALFSVMSLICALSWNFTSLLAFRTVQGIDLGARFRLPPPISTRFRAPRGEGGSS
jgi:MFS transporter, putative metabolite:H+ symporter